MLKDVLKFSRPHSGIAYGCHNHKGVEFSISLLRTQIQAQTLAEVYTETFQRYKMKRFAKIVNGYCLAFTAGRKTSNHCKRY